MLTHHSKDHPPHAESNVNSSEASSSSEHDDASPIGVSCPHASNGCPWNGSRSDLDISHLPHCPFEAIKGFFDVFSSKTGALSDENAVLRRKVEALEGTVNVLMRENEEVRRALGPWYRLDHHIGENVHPSSRYTTEIITGIPERPTPRPLQRLSPTNLGTTTSAHPESTSSATPTPPTSDGAIPAPRPHLTTDSLPTSLHHGTIDTPDLAQWFPPVDVEEIGLEEGEVLEHQSNILFSMDGANAPSWDSAIVSRSPPSSHSYSYYDPHSLPHSSASVYATPASAVPVPGQLPSTTASPPHIPAVAPLNISSSLHGTLLSLRESIVTLTSAVDSLARRQDVGLATEAMRINEEIRSLRVVTHGIRVQVSGRCARGIVLFRALSVTIDSSLRAPPDALHHDGPKRAGRAWLVRPPPARVRGFAVGWLRAQRGRQLDTAPDNVSRSTDALRRPAISRIPVPADANPIRVWAQVMTNPLLARGTVHKSSWLLRSAAIEIRDAAAPAPIRSTIHTL